MDLAELNPIGAHYGQYTCVSVDTVPGDDDIVIGLRDRGGRERKYIGDCTVWDTYPECRDLGTDYELIHVLLSIWKRWELMGRAKKA
jgi:hypothetical protein